jgi:hypothetical protein
MAAGSPTPPVKQKTKVKVDTTKLVLIIVEMHASHDAAMKQLTTHLAACIIEAYDDTQEMVRDIISTYISPQKLLPAMRVNMKRVYPESSKILSDIFGVVIFGETL